ncbi:MAG: glycosyltransferase [Novosphingobium sp.]
MPSGVAPVESGSTAPQAGNRPGVLYLSYDGMLEPLGQGQVITYLERLSRDARVHLVSFEKPADRAQGDKFKALAARLAAAGISWHPLRYHKKPTLPATLIDIAQGTVVAVFLAARHGLSIVHARSYIPALIGWFVKLLTGARLLFDMRGLWADERADGGAWPRSGRVYRSVKRIERTLLLGADHIVTLTEASKREIESFPYFAGRHHASITVIPTCADLDRFCPDLTLRPRRFTLGYVGSVGPNYAFEATLALFNRLLRHYSEAELLVVNRNQHAEIRQAVRSADIDEQAIQIVAADHADVPGLIKGISAGVALMKPSYCELGRAPTRLAEYLGCGVPCIGNENIGDVAAILKAHRVGVVLPDFSEQSLDQAVTELGNLLADPDTPARCRAAAEALFSVDQGARSYSAIYAQLTGETVL